MAQMHGYKITRQNPKDGSNEQRHYVKHTARDVLRWEGITLALGETAKRNHWYHCEDGTQVMYVCVSLAEARQQQVVEHNLANNSTINLRLSVNDDSHLTGDTIADGAMIEALGAPAFLNKLDYEMLCKLANAQGITVSAPADSMYRFNTASGIYAEFDEEIADIEKEVSAIEARVSGAQSIAAYTIPQPSNNSFKGKTGAMFGRICKLQEDNARLERRVKQQEILLSNAAIRERELRAQLIHGAVYTG
jgi:hypothetical protein